MPAESGPAPPGRVTRALDHLEGRELRDAGEVYALVERELKEHIRRLLVRDRPDPLLQATSLLHDALLKVLTPRVPRFHDRKHFYGFVCRTARQLLVDAARAADRNRRVDLDLERLATGELRLSDMPDLDAALRRLERVSPRQARIVELRWLAGLSRPQVADLLGVSLRTVDYDWEKARAWLFRDLSGR